MYFSSRTYFSSFDGAFSPGFVTYVSRLKNLTGLRFPLESGCDETRILILIVTLAPELESSSVAMINDEWSAAWKSERTFAVTQFFLFYINFGFSHERRRSHEPKNFASTLINWWALEMEKLVNEKLNSVRFSSVRLLSSHTSNTRIVLYVCSWGSRIVVDRIKEGPTRAVGVWRYGALVRDWINPAVGAVGDSAVTVGVFENPNFRC